MAPQKTKLAAMAAFLLAALVLQQASADWSADLEACNKGCDATRPKDPSCRDLCTVQGDYAKARFDTAECDKTCVTKPPGEESACKRKCAVTTVAAVGFTALRECGIDCKWTAKDAADQEACKNTCEENILREDPMGIKHAISRMDGCFRRCAPPEEKNQDVVNACMEKCPLTKLANDLLKDETVAAAAEGAKEDEKPAAAKEEKPAAAKEEKPAAKKEKPAAAAKEEKPAAAAKEEKPAAAKEEKPAAAAKEEKPAAAAKEEKPASKEEKPAAKEEKPAAAATKEEPATAAGIEKRFIN